MFQSFWCFGWVPLCGHTVQIKVRTVATLEEEPKNWKLFLILFKTAFYIRERINYEN